MVVPANVRHPPPCLVFSLRHIQLRHHFSLHFCKASLHFSSSNHFVRLKISPLLSRHTTPVTCEVLIFSTPAQSTILLPSPSVPRLLQRLLVSGVTFVTIQQSCRSIIAYCAHDADFPPSLRFRGTFACLTLLQYMLLLSVS
jgi:hypothetical protein